MLVLTHGKLMIPAANVVSNAPLEIRVFVGLHDGKNWAGGFGDIAYGLIVLGLVTVIQQLTRHSVGIWWFGKRILVYL